MATSQADGPDLRPIGSVEPALPSDGSDALFGSDVIAETLRDLDIPYIALTPGASFRGLHDSLVNHLGNERPTMLMCLHEEHAVAIAHGYAKVTGRPMAAAVHSNVGLMHATMAIFNAWCDRMPAVVIGATGPVDAAKRRPWIDWIHTARDQGAIVRHYVKWDDQPASAEAAQEALVRANWLCRIPPKGPVYINLDSEMQEASLEGQPARINVQRFAPAISNAASPPAIEAVARMLQQARHPVMLAGRVSRSPDCWNRRIALAEAFRMRVITNSKLAAAFPTDHPLHVGVPTTFLSRDATDALRTADMIISLDWLDLAGTLKTAFDGAAPGAHVVQISLDHTIHNGWSQDHQALPPVDTMLAADPDTAVDQLTDALDLDAGRALSGGYARDLPQAEIGQGMTVRNLGIALRRAVGDREASLLHLPLSWDGSIWPWRHPLDFIGGDGGGGIGGGPGISVGAALALRGSRRLPVAITGDGDFLMGATALWTAVHYRIPMLMVVANNRSFFNDEVHQERVARMRNRPVENRWIGQRIADPEPDLGAIAIGQGAKGFGPVTDVADLQAVFAEAIRAVEEGHVAVVDVRVESGYFPGANASAQTTEANAKN